MSALTAHHVRLGSPRRLQTAHSLEVALSIALEAEYGRYVYVVDWEQPYVFFTAEGREGIRRRSYTEAEDGSVTLGQAEDVRVRPRASYQQAGGRPVSTPAFEAQKQQHLRKLALIDKILTAPGSSFPQGELEAMSEAELTKLASLAGRVPFVMSDRDYAPMLASPWAEAPRVAVVPYLADLAPEVGARLHMMAHVGDDADYAQMPASVWDPRPAPVDDDPNYANLPASTWGKRA